MTCYPVSALNERLHTDAAGLIAEADAAYDALLTGIAEDIRDNYTTRPIILLSGPSGSGKTTTARMIEAKLDAWGFETHTLSMDDYFLPLTDEQRELLAAGALDLETPKRVDIPFLNGQLADIIAGRPVDLPRFDFERHDRVFTGRILERKPNELVIVEGIHALIPKVVTIPEEQTMRLYVSVRTRLKTADGTILHPDNIRLMRRMLRDQLFRGRAPEETLAMFDSVQTGARRYILPYKHRAHYEIDTFSPYEVSAYKSVLEAPLAALDGHPELETMRQVLAQIEPVDPALIPSCALVREFLGGSDFA